MRYYTVSLGYERKFWSDCFNAEQTHKREG